MHDPTQEINKLLKNFYLQKYEDVFYVIIYALGGSIHQSQLYRWLNRNQYRNIKVFPDILADWERIGLIRKHNLGSCCVLYMRFPVYRYFGLTYCNSSSASKLKRTSLIMEKFLTEEHCYNSPPSSLRRRIQKTNLVGYLPSGQAHLNVVNNYIRALQPYGWFLVTLQNQANMMQKRIERSPSRNHFKKVSDSVEKSYYEENLYSLSCKGVCLTGAKITKANDTVTFTLHADIFNSTDMNNAKLATLVINTYRLLTDLTYDSINSKHKSDILITVYSHQANDTVLIEKVYSKLLLTKEFCTYDREKFNQQIQFVFFDTIRHLFNGISTDRIV